MENETAQPNNCFDSPHTLSKIAVIVFVECYAHTDGVKSWTNDDWINKLKIHYPNVVITEELMQSIRDLIEDEDKGNDEYKDSQTPTDLFDPHTLDKEADEDEEVDKDEEEEYAKSMEEEAGHTELFDENIDALNEEAVNNFVQYYLANAVEESWTDDDWVQKIHLHYQNVNVTDELIHEIRELIDEDDTDNDEEESSNDEDSNCKTKIKRKCSKLSQTSMLSAKDNNDSERSLKFYLIQETKATKKFKAGFSTQTESSLVKRYKTLIKSAFKVHTCILDDFMNGSERVYDAVLKSRIKHYLCSREESEFDDFSLPGIQLSNTYAYDAFRHEHYTANNTPEILQVFIDIKNMSVQQLRDEAFELENCSTAKSIFLSRRVAEKLPWSKEFINKGT